MQEMFDPERVQAPDVVDSESDLDLSLPGSESELCGREDDPDDPGEIYIMYNIKNYFVYHSVQY